MIITGDNMTKARKIAIGKAALTFVLFYLRQYLQIIPIYLFQIDVEHATANDTVLVNLFLNLMLAIALFILYHKELKQEFQKFKGNFKENFDAGLRYWLMGLTIMVVTNVLISMFTPLQNSSNEMTVQALIATSPILMLLTAGVLAPIVEELTFRKAMRGIFTNKWVFFIVSSFVFGLMHVIGSSNWYEYFYIISYGGLGFSFAYAYDKTDTIFTPITIHMLHNTLLILLSFI